MNKRGDEEASPRTGVIAAVIAAFVLVLVLLGLWLFFSGRLPFFQYLPSFNQTKPMIIHSEIFRYSLPEDKLQVYDGTSWADLKLGEIEVNNKKISTDRLRKELIAGFIGQKTSLDGSDLIVTPAVMTSELGWWQRTKEFWGASVSPTQKMLIPAGTVEIFVGTLPNKPLEIKNDPGLTYLAVYYRFDRVSEKWQYMGRYPGGITKESWTNVESMKAGDYTAEQYEIALSLARLDEKEGYRRLGALTYYMPLTGGLYQMNSDRNGLNFVGAGIIPVQDPLGFESRVIKWRDELISQSVEISYSDTRGAAQSVKTCYLKSKYEDTNSRSLVVDLSRPVPAGQKCPYLD